MRKNKWGRLVRTAGTLFWCLLFSLALCLFAACRWIDQTLHINFTELLYTLVSPLTDAGGDVVSQCVAASIPALCLIAFYILLSVALLLLHNALAASKYQIRLTLRAFSLRRQRDAVAIVRGFRRLAAAVSVLALAASLWYADQLLEIRGYLKSRMTSTTLYEDYFVDPAEVEITGGGKNLIYLYMESMEITYASQEVGGYQPETNYIPNLTALAQENTSFSNSTALGGFRSLTGTTWTMGALFATTAGIPFSFPVEQNSVTHADLASGVTALGDILEDKGYQNEFICGSRAEFGGRKNYLTRHGNYKIFDIFTARETGYVPPDYHNGHWGYDDQMLYQIAKDELLAAAQSGQPFNMTILTVDTHFPRGHICPLCEDTYETIAENVVSCADQQAIEFIDWCRQQDFYKDTVMIVTGDHPRMDTYLVEGIDFYDRTVYNCILNGPEASRTENREFTAMDMLPTALAAMGFSIEGERLALGTNLYSGESTLAEQLGTRALEEEIEKYSPYYVKNFA